jgi:predicted Zn-ribbon and HTH transcriptional regulator
VTGIDLGAIVRAASEEYLATHTTSSDQRKALRAIAACRTEALGGEKQQCDRCGFEHIVWHSCRNRHCPRCQANARAQWLEERREELLPVPYFHVVFTIPEELNILALWAPRVLYDAMLRCAGQTLLEVGRSKLGVELGALCVLHTWGQTLPLHPHIHCVVPGGGFAAGGAQGRSVRKPSFFLPVKVLSRRFRTLLSNTLREIMKLIKPTRPDTLSSMHFVLGEAPVRVCSIHDRCQFSFLSTRRFATLSLA